MPRSRNGVRGDKRRARKLAARAREVRAIAIAKKAEARERRGWIVSAIKKTLGSRIRYSDKVVHFVMPDGSHRRADKPSERGWRL